MPSSFNAFLNSAFLNILPLDSHVPLTASTANLAISLTGVYHAAAAVATTGPRTTSAHLSAAPRWFLASAGYFGEGKKYPGRMMVALKVPLEFSANLSSVFSA